MLGSVLLGSCATGSNPSDRARAMSIGPGCTITVTADDGQALNHSVSRTFTVTVTGCVGGGTDFALCSDLIVCADVLEPSPQANR